MAYHQITPWERIVIWMLLRQGKSAGDIARQLGRHRSTIYREVGRNCSRSDGFYRPQQADSWARTRRSRSRRNYRITDQDWELVEKLLKIDWSPEQIAGRLKRIDRLQISHETIYLHVWADKRRGGTLYEHLRGATKLRRKRHGTYDSRGRLAGKRPIEVRPAAADNRSRVGHWEADTMLGDGKPCVVTLVERKTGYVQIGKLNARTTQQLSRRTIQLIQRQPRPVRTVTADTTAMPTSKASPTPASISPRPIILGNEAPTRTPTDSSDNTSPSDRSWPHSPSTTATPSLASSTPDLGNDSVTELLRSATNPQLLHYKVDAKRTYSEGDVSASLSVLVGSDTSMSDILSVRTPPFVPEVPTRIAFNSSRRFSIEPSRVVLRVTSWEIGHSQPTTVSPTATKAPNIRPAIHLYGYRLLEEQSL